MDEFAGIRSWTENRQQKSWQQERGVVVGIGDDAAVVEATPGKGGTGSTSSWQSLITVDTMVETIHFNDLTMLEEDVGYKALAANISDIAAMGGIPRHAVISVSVPPSYSPQRVKQIYDGLYACANQYGVAIVGGDTTSSPSHLVLAVTLTGIIESGRSVYRSGAQPGDAVFVTGLLGMSAAGLDYLMKLPEKYGKVVPYRELAATAQKMADTEGAGALVRHHRRPQPSVAAGRLLISQGACHALNDVSDGLASEAWELAESSQVSIVLSEHLLPRSASLLHYAEQTGKNPVDWMLYGGEDYVLVGTMPEADLEQAKEELNRQGIPLYRIGRVESGAPGVWMYGSDGGERTAILKRGYNHFSESNR
ncbi:thiamine-phosphate kinase [Paenibacillus pinihumi]|uniref:thiamine-phosphate kinase n=1 Tax=Paenibacillus pinihumi TaxID=669462 RepID=UPI0004028D33|nr:thiamine-phosphate kinase [Paenibacillus pinihumi]